MRSTPNIFKGTNSAPDERTYILENIDTADLAKDKGYESMLVSASRVSRAACRASSTGHDTLDRNDGWAWCFRVEHAPSALRRRRAGVMWAMPAPIRPLIEAAIHWPERGALVGLDSAPRPSASPSPIPTAGGDWRRNAPPGVQGRCAAIGAIVERNVVGFCWTSGCMAGARRSAPIDPRLCPQFWPTGLAIALWDSDFDRGRRARADPHGRLSRPSRRGDHEHAAIFILQGALDRLTKLRGIASYRSRHCGAFCRVPADALGFILKRT